MTTTAPVVKIKQVWVDKFHPNNGRLKQDRLRKLSVEALDAWANLGRAEIARYLIKDETFKSFSYKEGGSGLASMRDWCEKKVAQIERVRAMVIKESAKGTSG